MTPPKKRSALQLMASRVVAVSIVLNESSLTRVFREQVSGRYNETDMNLMTS